MDGRKEAAGMVAEKVFAEGIAKEIKDYLPEEYKDIECSVVETRKNNGVMLVGLCPRIPGQEIAPVVYVEPFYQALRQGEPMERIKADIAEMIEGAMEVRSLPDEQRISEYGEVKERLQVRLVNMKANRMELKKMPHRKFEDLSLMLAVSISVDGENKGTVKVTNEMASLWGVSEEEMFRQAWENMKEKQPPIIFGMSEVLKDVCMGEVMDGRNVLEMESASELDREYMYVLSNGTVTSYGAAALACPGVQEKLGEIFPDGYYVLPSSVHETLILPKNGIEPEPIELGEMVRDINRKHVKKAEVLSDNVYEYDRGQEKICMVSGAMKREKEAER